MATNSQPPTIKATAATTGRGYTIAPHKRRFCLRWFDEWNNPHTKTTFRTRREAEAFGDAEILRVASARLESIRQQLQPQPSLFAEMDCSSATDRLSELSEQYRLMILAGGAKLPHAKETRLHLDRLNQLCGFAAPNQIAPTRLKLVLGALVRNLSIEEAKLQNTAGMARLLRRALSYRSRNKHLGSFKGFCRWLVGESKLSAATCAAIDLIKPLNAKLDRRHERAAPRDEFLVKLINTAIDGPPWNEYSGAERAAFYLFQAASGLREGATRQITVAQLSLRAIQPTVTELIHQEKAGKERLIPLRHDDAAWLQIYLEAKSPTDLAFHIPRKEECAEMMRFDMTRAGLSWGEVTIDDNGIRRRKNWIDVHALKAAYSTRLHLLGGASKKVLEDLVGHSTAELTMEHYVKTIPQDALDVLHRLPPLAIKPLPRTG